MILAGKRVQGPKEGDLPTDGQVLQFDESLNKWLPVTPSGGSSETVYQAYLTSSQGASSSNDGVAGIPATFIKQGSIVTLKLGQFYVDAWNGALGKELLAVGWIPAGFEPVVGSSNRILVPISYYSTVPVVIGSLSVEALGVLNFGKDHAGETPDNGAYYETNGAAWLQWTTVADLPDRP